MLAGGPERVKWEDGVGLFEASVEPRVPQARNVAVFGLGHPQTSKGMETGRREGGEVSSQLPESNVQYVCVLA